MIEPQTDDKDGQMQHTPKRLDNIEDSSLWSLETAVHNKGKGDRHSQDTTDDTGYDACQPEGNAEERSLETRNDPVIEIDDANQDTPKDREGRRASPKRSKKLKVDKSRDTLNDKIRTTTRRKAQKNSNP
jgi:hypothetical protein